jgi:hypothetical protein
MDARRSSGAAKAWEFWLRALAASSPSRELLQGCDAWVRCHEGTQCRLAIEIIGGGKPDN